MGNSISEEHLTQNMKEMSLDKTLERVNEDETNGRKEKSMSDETREGDGRGSAIGSSDNASIEVANVIDQNYAQHLGICKSRSNGSSHKHSEGLFMLAENEEMTEIKSVSKGLPPIRGSKEAPRLGKVDENNFNGAMPPKVLSLSSGAGSPKAPGVRRNSKDTMPTHQGDQLKPVLKKHTSESSSFNNLDGLSTLFTNAAKQVKQMKRRQSTPLVVLRPPEQPNYSYKKSAPNLFEKSGEVVNVNANLNRSSTSNASNQEIPRAISQITSPMTDIKRQASATSLVGSLTPNHQELLLPINHPNRLSTPMMNIQGHFAITTSYMHLKQNTRKLQKVNSCSTLFIDNTINRADLYEMLKCTSLAIYYSARCSHEMKTFRSHDIFSEKIHPLTRDLTPDKLKKLPDEHVIFAFLEAIFRAIQLNSEVAIIAMIYMERMMKNTGVTIYCSNWRRVVLGAIVLASKVWDDQAVWNVDFCGYLSDIPPSDINNLERWYLKAINYNVNVKGSVYANYFFELRAIVDKADATVLLKPLTKENATKLDMISTYEGNQRRPSKPHNVLDVAAHNKSMKKSKSDYLTDHETTAVIM